MAAGSGEEPGRQPSDCMDEFLRLGTGDSLALALLVGTHISPLAGECIGGKSLPFWVSGAHSAVSAQLNIPA